MVSTEYPLLSATLPSRKVSNNLSFASILVALAPKVDTGSSFFRIAKFRKSSSGNVFLFYSCFYVLYCILVIFILGSPVVSTAMLALSYT